MQRHIFILASPPGGFGKGQIPFNFNYKVNIKYFYTTLCVCVCVCVCSLKLKIENISTGVLIRSRGYGPRGGTWGAWGQKFDFSERGIFGISN